MFSFFFLLTNETLHNWSHLRGQIHIHVQHLPMKISTFYITSPPGYRRNASGDYVVPLASASSEWLANHKRGSCSKAEP